MYKWKNKTINNSESQNSRRYYYMYYTYIIEIITKIIHYIH